jgi:hypothetical protein
MTTAADDRERRGFERSVTLALHNPALYDSADEEVRVAVDAMRECTPDCEPFAHYGCPTAEATARTESAAREVVQHGRVRPVSDVFPHNVSGEPLEHWADDPESPSCAAPEIDPAIEAADGMLGIYAEAFRRDRIRYGAGERAVTAINHLPAEALRPLLIAALARLADAEDAR